MPGHELFLNDTDNLNIKWNTIDLLPGRNKALHPAALHELD